MPSPIKGTIAFWITPAGEIHLVKDTHIQYVIDHPDLFGIDLDALRRRYDDFNEEWGCEGQARGEAIRDLVSKGWIRVRRYPNDYSVNVPELDGQARARLCQLARVLLKQGIDGRYERDAYMPLRITELAGSDPGRVRLIELKAFLPEGETTQAAAL